MRQLELDIDDEHPRLSPWTVRVLLLAFAIAAAGLVLLYLSFSSAERRQEAAEVSAYEQNVSTETSATEAEADWI